MDDVSRLLEEIKTLGDALPPVASWHPERTVTVDIRIDRNGQWFHEGGKITRIEMSRLFSTILRKDPDGYCLVTPVERCLIQVDDVPFTLHLEQVLGCGDSQEIFLRSQMNDLLRLDVNHALFMESYQGDIVPYVHVRHGMKGRVDRASYYHLMKLVEIEGGKYGIKSAGQFFMLA